MNQKFGFIGAGNMGGALAQAAAKAMPGENIFIADLLPEKAEALAKKLGCNHAEGTAVAWKCGFIFLGVKPQVMGSTLASLAEELRARADSFVLVSMAAGVSIADIRRMAGADYPVIRIMPNIPASTGSGVILYDYTENVPQEAVAVFCEGMRFAGIVDHLPEKLIDAASALSGCGPAFVSLFVEALADGAVACGLPRDKAMLYAMGTVEGTAKMLRESGMHPAQLKDAVCSPGGNTIEGVRTLEEGGLRGTTMNAVISAYDKTCRVGK